MRQRPALRWASSVLALALATAVTAASQPASGSAGSWTRITTPASTQFEFFHGDQSTDTLQVVGSASSDLNGQQVYIGCWWQSDQEAFTQLNADPVTITNGAFAGTINAPQLGGAPGCVLRAIPASVRNAITLPNGAYLGGFSGPTYYPGSYTRTVSGTGSVENFTAVVQYSSAFFSTYDLDSGVSSVQLSDPATHTLGPVAAGGGLALGHQNVAAAFNSTASGIVIDGHNAYAPRYLGQKGFAVPAGSTATASRNTSTGSLHTTQGFPLTYCTDETSYEPATCAEAPTGVSVVSTTDTAPSGLTTTLHVSLSATDGKSHTVAFEFYNNQRGTDVYDGQWGFRLPGHSSWSPPGTPGTSTGLLRGVHTLFTTADIYASPDQATNSYVGFTYSAAGRLVYGANDSSGDGIFGFKYSRTLSPGHPVRIAYVREVGTYFSQVSGLAATAVKQLTPHLRISAPKSGSTISDRTPAIKGRITNATNGLPSTVTLKIGTTSKTVHVSSTGTFTTTWTTLAAGKHKLTAKTTDPGGVVLTGASTFTVG